MEIYDNFFNPPKSYTIIYVDLCVNQWEFFLLYINFLKFFQRNLPIQFAFDLTETDRAQQ